MAGKGKTHKRLIAILNFLREETENSKPIDINKLQNYLGELSATRQIIYNDLYEIEAAGAGVIHDKNKHYYYENYGFSNGELSLLADVICSSSYLDAESAEKLILHIKQMTNMKKFDDLTKQTDIFLRNKTLNSECIRNVDLLHDAIREYRNIEFSYAKYDEQGMLCYDYISDDGAELIKVKVPISKRKGECLDVHNEIEPGDSQFGATSVRKVSPYKLVWDNSRCYLIGGVDYKGLIQIRVYRVDKIFNLKILSENSMAVSSASAFYDHDTESFDVRKFMKSIFNMYGSKDSYLTKVEFCVSNKLVGVVFDKFGADTTLNKYDDEHSSFWADIQVSNMFFGWLARFKANEMKILYPKTLQNEFKKHLQGILKDIQ